MCRPNVRGVSRYHGDGREGERLPPDETRHALAWEDYLTKVIDIGYLGTERLKARGDQVRFRSVRSKPAIGASSRGRLACLGCRQRTFR